MHCRVELTSFWHSYFVVQTAATYFSTCDIFRTVAIDMRGYGESDKPVGISEYYIDKLTFDVKETIEGLGNTINQ